MTDDDRYHAVGVLAMAHGTPSDPDELAEFYTRIRRGNPPSAEQLDDLRRRYEAIGGTSPLAEVTVAQARALRLALGLRMPVAVGTRFASPSIEDAVAALQAWGARRAVGIVLAPQFSRRTTGEYLRRAREAAGEIDFAFVESWHSEPRLIDFFAAEVARLLGEVPSPARVLFTAHSLPVSALHDGDPYPGQVAETAAGVAGAAGCPPGSWSQAWQSAGRTDEEWIGPDVRDVLVDLASAGTRSVVVCPVGFSADNMETLYDLDIEAAAVARESGVTLARTALPNADPGLAAGLAQRIVEAASRLEDAASRREDDISNREMDEGRTVSLRIRPRR